MKYYISIILLFTGYFVFSQIDKKSVCKIADNRLNFYLDTKWTEEEKEDVSESFDLDSLLMANAYNLTSNFMYDSVEWRVKKINNRIIELSKELNVSSLETIESYNYETVDIEKLLWEAFFNEKSEKFGINKFSDKDVFLYKDGYAHFYLPGYTNSRKVYLSGSFNSWSTMQSPMQFVDSGWKLSIKMKPGKYFYKYIVDGNWISDPFNKQTEKNEHGTYNSVVFCTNHLFILKGYNNKKKVFVAGSFNNWNAKELKMNLTEDGYELPIWLKEGTHTYKFIVNREWILDSLNPLKRDDGTGILNSVLELGGKYTFFTNEYPDAAKMILTGSFNDWNEHELIMNKTDSGWVYDYTLGPGVHEYKFIADGKWLYDKKNPYTKGTGVFTNSVLIFKPNYTFELNGYQDRINVCITGAFNDWNPEGYPMQKKEGKWIFPAYLEKGKQLYKFIVDGEWILDPDNPLWENNQYGTNNSVLWID